MARKTIREQIYDELGPPPEAPADLRFLGWQLNPDAQARYKFDRDIYNHAASRMAENYANQVSSPMRDMTLGQVSEFGGFKPEELADKSQYRSVPRSEPSQVPSYKYIPTTPNDPLVSRQQLEGPPTPIHRELEGPGAPMLRPGMESQFEQKLRQQNSFQRGLGYSAPDKAEELYPTAGLMMEGPRPSRTEYQEQPYQTVTEPSTGPAVRGSGPGQFARLVGTPFAAGGTAQAPIPGMPGSQPMSLENPRDTGVQSQPQTQTQGQFVQGPGRALDYSTREVDPDAPANLWQQAIGASLIKRESVWPKNYGSTGSGGANTLAAKVKMNFEGYMALHPEADPQQVMGWAQIAAATGDPMPDTFKSGNMTARTDASGARAGRDRMSTQLAPRRQDEVERHNRAMEQLRARGLDIQNKQYERMQKAQDSKDWIQVERLNEQRYWHDQLMLAYGATDKADLFSDEQQSAFSDAMGIVERLGDRPPTDEELGLLERLTGNKRPRFKYEPRKPLPSGAPNSMQRQPKDTKKPGPDLPQVNSQEEYDELPKGTRYRDSQGNEATKK